jgi:mono/diheme cytochrome c family protein
MMTIASDRNEKQFITCTWPDFCVHANTHALEYSMPSSPAASLKTITVGLLLFSLAARCVAGSKSPAQNSARSSVPLSATRKLPSDLEVGGELAGLPAGTTRYAPLDSLLALPLVTYTVTDDPDLPSPSQISGIPLEDLTRMLGAEPFADMIVAICDDKYRANYPRDYINEHHPLLVLRVNGRPPSGWPKDPESHSDLGPYMISHSKFTPSFKILSHADEAQIPWGVVRLEFRDEKAVFSAIAPPVSRSGDASVQAGYKIAQQYCFHCHNAGQEGGQKAGRSWQVLAAFASSAPDYFSAYVRDPKSKNASAQMPANPAYDDTTIAALRDYFATFVVPAAKP